MPSKKKSTTNFFPAKLHSLLEHAETRGYDNIISWQEGGNSFKVWNPEIFVTAIMPKYFKQTKLKSFQRQLNIYGWKRIGTGRNRGGYFHPSFVHGVPELCLLLKRAPLPDSKSSSHCSSSKQNDDDDDSTAVAAITPICLVETMPRNINSSSMNTNSSGMMFGAAGMDHQHHHQQQSLYNNGYGNSLLGGNMINNNNNQNASRDALQVRKTFDGQSSSNGGNMMRTMTDPMIMMMDPFGVRGLSSFGLSSSRNTGPRMMIGGKGKLSEDMHLFADLFNPRDFQDDFNRDDFNRDGSIDFSSINTKAQQTMLMMLMNNNNLNNSNHRNMMQVGASRDSMTYEDDLATTKQSLSQQQHHPDAAAAVSVDVETPGACENVFPQKLHFLLNQAEKEGFDHIISWVNDGAAFKVHDSRAFLEQVMPNYFDQSKFESFRRQLNLYGFQRVSRGPSRGIYYHQFFLQSEPSLCQSITRPSTTTTMTTTTNTTASPARALKC